MSKLGRRANNVLVFDDGREVSYTPKVRGGYFKVQFKHPTEPGKYAEAATGVEVPNGWNKNKRPPAQWFTEATKAIKLAYTPAASEYKKQLCSKLTWEEAETYFLAVIKRIGSKRTYRSSLLQLKAAMPNIQSPEDITSALAERFILKYASEPYRRSKAEGGVMRTRGAETVKTMLRNLSVIWSRLKRHKLIQENVWSKVERPKVPKKEPLIPEEDVFVFFFNWLDKRFPGPDGKGWPLLRTFMDVKSVAGCRLNDLAQVKTWQFDKVKKTLFITADQDKTNQERLLHLPDDLVVEVEKCCGPEFLWERYVIDSAVYRPGIRRARKFRPSVLYYAVQSIFKEYNRAHPDKKLKTHDFRRRAVTLLYDAFGGDLDAVARVLNITVETARRHYLALRRVRDRDALQKQHASILIVKRQGEVVTEKAADAVA